MRADKLNQHIRVMVVGRFTAIHTRRFAEELQRQGAEVAALWFGQSKEQPRVKCFQPSVRPRILGLRGTAKYASLRYLRHTIADFAPHIIHVQDDPLMVKWLHGTRPSSVKLAYTSWGHYPKSVLNDKDFQHSLQDAVLVASDAPDVLEEITPFAPRAHREIMRFGAEFDLFSPGAPDLKVLSQYCINASDCYLLSPRSIRPNYNQLTLIRALPAVVEKFPNLKLILKHHHVENYTDAADYERRIRDEAQQLGVWERIIRLDHIPYSHLCHLYRVSRAAISIPLEDGFPATIFEAMAAGCPLIVSRDESYKGVITDGSNALTIPPTDSVALSNSLLRILGDEAFAQKLRLNGLATVREKGDFSKEVARMLKKYRELMDGEIQ